MGTPPPGTATIGAASAIAAGLAATDLRPGPVVNALFQALVATACGVPDGDPEYADPRALAALHRLCSRGESHLEAHWARRVIRDPHSVAEFPYLDNYRRMVESEHAAIADALGRPPRTVVFAGSGPLPLTAVLLGRSAPGLRVTCLDTDRRALRQGRRVARALAGTRAWSTPGLSTRAWSTPGLSTPAWSAPRFVRADATGYDYAGYDVVVVAALVGLTPAEKTAVLARVAGTLAPGSLLAARSVPADGRRLLYPRIDPATVPDTLTVLGESKPPSGVINSLLLMTPTC